MVAGTAERRTGLLLVAGLVLLAGCQPGTTTVITPYGFFTRTVLIVGPADGVTGLSEPAYIDFGPDGRLYITTYTGSLLAIGLNADHTVADVQEFQPIPGRILTGFAFDPDAPVSEPVLYLVNNAQPLYGADDFTGRVSRVTGAGFDQVVDVIDGLPRSNENHMTFSLLFGPDGRLYIGQAGNTNHGAAGPGLFGDRPESELSAAILVADVTNPGFGGIADVEVYAPGLRNPYGMCLHSNGHIYIEDQGGNQGLGGPPGPGGVGMVGTGEDTPDELNVLMPDVYYGHPNPARGELAYDADLTDGTPYMPPISTLPRGSVVTCVKEYASSANGGQLQGKLLLTGFLDGNIHYVSLSADGLAVTGQGILAGGFINPIDLVVSPDGTLYVLEAGGTLSFGGIGPAKLTALVPEQPGAAP